MAEPTPYYRAFCPNCDCTVETNHETDRWLDPFFLPRRCPGCHHYMSSTTYSGGWTWQVEFGYWRFVPADPQPPKVWWNPFTWGTFGARVWTKWMDRT